jgi:hypothetical protein
MCRASLCAARAYTATLRKTVTVLSHCVKRTMTLTQNDLPAAGFDVCVHLHNKAQADECRYCAGI